MFSFRSNQKVNCHKDFTCPDFLASSLDPTIPFYNVPKYSILRIITKAGSTAKRSKETENVEFSRSQLLDNPVLKNSN